VRPAGALMGRCLTLVALRPMRHTVNNESATLFKDCATSGATCGVSLQDTHTSGTCNNAHPRYAVQSGQRTC
jgi:hypothetical protein